MLVKRARAPWAWRSLPVFEPARLMSCRRWCWRAPASAVLPSLCSARTARAQALARAAGPERRSAGVFAPVTARAADRSKV